MDMNLLMEISKLYYERNGKFEPDDYKRFVPDTSNVDKLKSKLVLRDAESSDLPLEISMVEQQPDGKDIAE
jgi:hypothetical protein